MRMSKRFVLLALLMQIAACSGNPPKFISPGRHPLIERDGTVNILADVCIKYDALGDSDDHFVGVDSRLIATNLLQNAADYLSPRNGIQINSTQAPFVCGATHNADNEPQQFAARTGSPIVSSIQPFDISSELTDPNYVNAQRIVSSYVFDHALNGANSDKTATNIFSGANRHIVGSAEFRAAASVIAAKSGQSNLLYIGVTGIRESKGKSTLKAVAATTVSAAVAGVSLGLQLSAPTVTVPTPEGGLVNIYSGWVMFPMFFPNFGVIGKQVVAVLIDLRSGELMWTNSVDGQTTSSSNSLASLLFDVTHKREMQWSPPGTPPQQTGH